MSKAMDKKPTIKTKCVANAYAGPQETIVEVWDAKLQIGCLISLRRVGKRLFIEPYRGDEGVFVRADGEDVDIGEPWMRSWRAT